MTEQSSFLSQLKQHYSEHYFKNVIYTHSTTSTNSMGIHDTIITPGIIIAGEQTAGRGRYKRVWNSPPKENIYCSLILVVDSWEKLAPNMILVATTLKEVIEHYIGKNVTLKWPNDLLINGDKCCGILTEAIPQDHKFKQIIGFGINCNDAPDNIPKTTSLKRYCGKVDHIKLLGTLLQELDKRLCHDRGYTDALKKWYEYCNLTGRRIKATVGGKMTIGTVTKIDHTGALHLKMTSGDQLIVVAGDIQMVDTMEDRC